MRAIGRAYTYRFEPEMLDLWLRHHLRCWWRLTGRNTYSDYAKHVRVTEDTLKHACLGLIDPPLQILNDMKCEWVKRDKEYEMTIQRYTKIPHEVLNE
jgi:hypothetical protein